ncbi:MAG TPA: hypothetical protein VKA66_02245, partial [Mycobacterium sp.]|nr:hypothetical protein [Mycobacterium sp.]
RWVRAKARSPPEPRAEASVYRRSPDITTVVPADSAHCDNMASSRDRLWRRLLTWAATVVGCGPS